MDHLCQLAFKSVHSFSKYCVHRFRNRRTDGHLTRRALGTAHLTPTKVFRRLSEQNHYKTTARCSGATPMGFSRRKISLSSACTISEKAIQLQHPVYDPDRAQKLISSSMSRRLSTCSISSKSMHVFLSNLANRQTDRQTNTGKNIYLLLCRRYMTEQITDKQTALPA